MRNGATLLDPARVDVRGALSTGQDVVIDVNVVFEGTVRLGDRVKIGPFCVLKDAVIGDDVEILSHCRIEGAEVGRGRADRSLRPSSVRVRDWRRASTSAISSRPKRPRSAPAPRSTISPISVMPKIGAEVNVGAGTITCNYDGANKHKTIIEDGAFIGSNSSLVAPVRVGKGATVGAGSSVSRMCRTAACA